jgi:hypothetical protein
MDENGEVGKGELFGMYAAWLLLLSVNKRLAGLSNRGHGFCGARSRISREMWVADFAWFCEAKARGSAPFCAWYGV